MSKLLQTIGRAAGVRGCVVFSDTALRSCYDDSTCCAETLFLGYHRKRKVRIRAARIRIG